MERVHIFFESLDSFMQLASSERPLYAIQIERTEPTGTKGIGELRHLIHISQVFSDTIHHCVIEVCSFFVPTSPGILENRRDRANRAWDLMIEFCNEHFDMCVVGCLLGYPKDYHMVTAVLSLPLLQALYAGEETTA